MRHGRMDGLHRYSQVGGLLPRVWHCGGVCYQPGARAYRKRRACCFCSKDVTRCKDGSILVEGRHIGCSDDAIGKTLSSVVNRRGGQLHLCWDFPCTVEEADPVIHATKLRWWSREAFGPPYLKPWGRQVLKDFDALEAPGEEEPGKEEREEAKKKPAGRRAGRKRKEKEKPAPTAGKAETEKLREKLKKLRRGVGVGTAPVGSGPILVSDSEDSEESEEESSDHAGASPRLHVGDKMGRPDKEQDPPDRRPGPLALVSVKKEKEEETAHETGKKKKRVRRKKKNDLPRDAAAQLLAQAAQVRENRIQERKEKKRKEKGSGGGKAKALVKLLLGGSGQTKKKKKKDRKGKKKKRSGGGDGPTSSPSGSDEEGSEEEEASDSSSSEFLAPLQRRSSRKPEAVLRMLVDHARHAMDQSSLVQTGEGSEVTSGVKMSTYFNLLIRPYHSSSSRDMKELNMLAVCLDELRGGELGKLGDSLASRFLAIHTAVNEGSWKSAQYLELHPLEPTQGAPTSLLLEAKKHEKLVNKSQGHEDWRRPKGGYES